MPITMSIGDFKLTRAVCEIRYESAYLIFDQTGHVIHSLRSSFKNLEVINPNPMQSTFRAEEGAFGLEVTQSRFTADMPDPTLEKFAGHCKRYFDTVAESLEVRVFLRIGLRVFFRRDFKDLVSSKDALNSLGLANFEPVARFGVEEPPQEILFRWENAEIGAVLRLKAESGAIDIVLPPELESSKSQLHKDINCVTLDIDYYTVAPAERAQWDPAAWIPQSMRRIKKEADKILSR